MINRLLESVTGRWVVAMLVFVVASAAAVLAQDTSGVTIVTAPQLTSVGAVVLASVAGTYILKRVLERVPVANQIPVWVYVCSLAIGFTYLGNMVFGTLQGDFWALAWNGVYNGAAASGFREWVHSGPGKPLEDTASKMPR